MLLSRLTGAANVVAGQKKASSTASRKSEHSQAEPEVEEESLSKRSTRLTLGRKRGKSSKRQAQPANEDQFNADIVVDAEYQNLSQSEIAFLPKYVRQDLSTAALPHFKTSRAAVLFVDISGFTLLGEKLRKQYPQLEAASKLALAINGVLKALTSEVDAFEGDVAKFAGDALLCAWESDDDTWSSERAKACALSMLRVIESKNQAGQSATLQLHGGIAVGSVMHFILGDERADLKWYLMSGAAVVNAAEMVDKASRGHILFARGPGEEALDLTMDTKSELVATSPSLRRMVSLGELKPGEEPPGRQRFDTVDDPFINQKISVMKRAYIPKRLRNMLQSGRIESGGGEMRHRVAIVFCTLIDLTMTTQELLTGNVDLGRLFLLNDTFQDIVRIVRSYDGEVRDLLFDDKGCVFIAVFGAYGEIDMPELKALRTATKLTTDLPIKRIKVGVSVGTCYVGLAGDDKRHDVVVMGHEVNMAARYMSKAEPGTVLVGPRLQEKTNRFYEFRSKRVELKKGQQTLAGTASSHTFDHDHDLSGEAAAERETRERATRAFAEAAMKAGGGAGAVVQDPNGAVIVYEPMKESLRSRRASFMVEYRYETLIPDVYFQGRRKEISKIEAMILRASKEKVGAVAVVQGPRGYGKTALVRQVRKRLEDKIETLVGAAFDLEKTPLYAFRQIIESLLGFFDTIPKSKAKLILSEWKQAGVAIDESVLVRLIPYLYDRIGAPPAAPAATKPDRRVSVLGSSRFSRLIGMGSVRLSSKTLQAAAAASPSAGPTTPIDEMRANDVRMTGSGGGSPTLGAMDPMTLDGEGHANPALLQTSSRMQMLKSKLPSLRSTSSQQSMGLLTPQQKSPGAAGASPVVGRAGGSNGGSVKSSTSLGPALEAERRLRTERRKSFARLDVMLPKELDDVFALISSMLVHAAKKAVEANKKKALVIVIEDTQWLDTASLQVLELMVERMQRAPKSYPNLVLLLTCRESEESSSEKMNIPDVAVRNLLEQRVLSSVNDVKLNLFLHLDVLSQEECDALVTSIVVKAPGEAVSKAVLDAVFTYSGGMPIAIANIMDLMKGRDGSSIWMDPHSQQWKWKAESLNGASVLETARAAFVSRVDDLPLATRDVLKIAACICDSKFKFKLGDIVDVVRKDMASKSRYIRGFAAQAIDEEALTEHLRLAVAVGLVKYNKAFISGIEEWAFASSAVAETVLELVPPDRRVELSSFQAPSDA